MVRYRRNFVAGGTFFFTVTLRDRRSDLLLRHIDLLRESFARVQTVSPFAIEAIVILPEHLHTIWTLPPGDDDYSGRWRAIKAAFVRALRYDGFAMTQNARGEADVWQTRFWEHTIRDESDLARHIDYIHINPVKHGHTKRAADWPHSSIHRFIEQGVLPTDWACAPEDSGFGEPP